ncbi:HNH endonuclease [bacterium]|nr:HNH endonuclease [bacterium]
MTRKQPYRGICARCGQPFESYDYRSNRVPRYCSRKCGQPNQYSRQTVKCDVCGKEFERKRYHVEMSGERGQFCGFDCYAQWQSENMSGQANPAYDPDAHAVYRCNHCGVEFERAKWVRGGDLKFCSRSCFQQYAKTHFRRRLPNSYGKSWRPAKRRAMDRDHHQCQDCGSKKKLVVHHIRPYKTFEQSLAAHELDNLVTLCRACHRRRHNQPTS